MKTDHIGYLTEDIDSSATAFEDLGYERQPVVEFEEQKCSVCFLTRKDAVKIELVRPYENNRSLLKLMKKCSGGGGNIPYHICYEVENLDLMLKELEDGDRFVQMFQPLAAPAFDGRRVCYLWSSETGFIEFVETSNNK